MDKYKFFSSMLSNIPIPDMWLDATALSGLSDGDPVATWPDKSGHGNNATQATPANRPSLETLSFNGRKSVYFDSANSEYMLLPTDIIRDVPGCSVFIAFRQGSSLPSAEKLLYIAPSSTQSAFLQVAKLGSPYYLYSSATRVTTDAATIVSTGTDLSADASYILSAVADYSNALLSTYVNGTGTGSDSLQSSGNTEDIALNAPMMGIMRDGVSDPLLGYIGEIMLYKRTLTAIEISLVHNYLKNRWGVS